MKKNSNTCIDAGTVNCPCPLAETGNCLICSRLAGEDKCDCSWCGLCIYNEFAQNDKRSRNKRCDVSAEIANRKWYGDDLITMEIKVPRGFAMEGARPGAFVFLNGAEDPFFNVPVSVMKTNSEEGTITFAVKVISAKTEAVAQAKERLWVRGIYRNGLLGEGLSEELLLFKGAGVSPKAEHWLVIAKGIGFAPAVNIFDSIGKGVTIDMAIDTEKINDEILQDNLFGCDAVKEGRVKTEKISLAEVNNEECRMKLNCINIEHIDDYDKVFVLASDHYIRKTAALLNVPRNKLIYSNNFHMCCGEGVCGACCHVDEGGNVSKMCKCRKF